MVLGIKETIFDGNGVEIRPLEMGKKSPVHPKFQASS